MREIDTCSRRMSNFYLIPLFLIAFGMAGCGPGKQAAAPPAFGPPEVSFITVKTEKVVLTSELPGRTTAYLVAEVRPQVGGIIQKRLFEEGANVKAGDLLYQIDPAQFQAAYERARAELTRAEAKIISIRFKYERSKALIQSKVISQQDFDNAESDLHMAEADIQASKAAEETAEINLDYTKVTAPISGRIGKSHVTVGALVTANHLIPLATIQQMNPIYVDATQSSADFLRLKRNITEGLIKNDEKGTKVKLLFEDGSPYPPDGEMKFRDITVDQSTGSFILRIVFPNPDNALLPGMYVRAMVEEGIVDDAVLVPHQSVSRNMRGDPFAMIVDASDKVEMRMLAIDRSIGEKWLVKEGLKSGDRVIMEGFQKIRPGAPVKAVDFEAVQSTAPAAVATPDVAEKTGK